MKRLYIPLIFLLFSFAASAQTKQFMVNTDTSKLYVKPGWNTGPTEYRLYLAGELVAYRKKDSAWVLIDPNKTQIILDSMYHFKRRQ